MRLARKVAVVMLVAAWTIPVGVAVAGKPSGSTDTGGGTIYFLSGGTLVSMNSDGTSKSTLPSGVAGHPSRALHGGRRWFLATMAVGGTNPDGTPHDELFAIRGDGLASVQLTSDTSFRIVWSQWAQDDSFVSFSATDYSPSGGPVSRLVRATVSFDASGTPSTSGVPSTVVTVSTVQSSTGSGDVPVVATHDWSPSGGQVVWTDTSGPSPALRVTTASSGSTATLATGSFPAWSPDGSKIAFGWDGVYTVAPDGTGLKRILKNGPRYGVHRPQWSPTGSHVVYWHDDWNVSPRENDVYRATASGSGATNLTADVATGVLPIGWR